ncbi:MAG: TIM barrel protein [Methylobacter sp.]|nr:TIM barrel protein [Methylobacter sp.]MDP2099055.1 TIM barrel protein [Methylobacter sp.]MDP2427563.1 TIM barrel protein [Methylobacter sp.]MDP3053731.1 TIM barrel protein [Methylobacter sp.]MDP3363853.1 TIM barrel protein [Methylobacter sp.]
MLKFTANLSLLFTEVALTDRFKAAKNAGFNAVEIQFPYALSAAEIKNQLDSFDLKLVLFNVDAADLLQGGEGLACIPEKREQFKQAVAQAVDYARLLEPEVINVLPGRCVDNSQLPDYLATFKENLRFAVETFAPLGSKTVFEAVNRHDMPGFIIHSGAQMLEILKQLNHADLFMQYDIYHLQMMGEDPETFIAEHATKIGHIQFADCPGRGQPGTGWIDFDRMFSAIEASAYLGWVGAEYKPVGATNSSLDWLKNSIG